MKRFYFVFTLVVAAVLVSQVAQAGGDWNDNGIKWLPYEAGLGEAEKSKKPICMVLYTDWCPHCTNYSKVFHDSAVVEKATQFVMIRINTAQQKDVSRKFAPDGSYVPRTFFLGSDGELDPSIHAPRQKYKYFYSEHDPASVLAGMKEALEKHGKK
jgi:thiol:disulfide interchange protein